MYSTGDLSRHLSDGRIEFLGRGDQQVKLRGYRIELGEIEAALDSHPAVIQSAVVLEAMPQGDGRLVAYAVIEPGASLATADMRQFLKGCLPDYMIPSILVRLDAMPLTPNGKIYRRGLPAPDQIGPEAEGEITRPRTPLEEVLAAMWADVLNLDEVGIDDDFFEIGGHSILVTQLVSRLRVTFQIELPMRTFFESPTVAQLAKAILSRREQGEKAERIAELLLSIVNCSDDEAEAMLRDDCYSDQGRTQE